LNPLGLVVVVIIMSIFPSGVNIQYAGSTAQHSDSMVTRYSREAKAFYSKRHLVLYRALNNRQLQERER
jgi:hypothetical protein